MGAFNVSFLNPKLRSSSKDYGFLIDQIQIKENQLSSDGKLAPGDYDVLISQAQQLYSHPGLSNSQRSNILVKISNYNEQKSVNKLKDKSDVSRLNSETDNDMRKIIYAYNSNNFGEIQDYFLKSKQKILELKRFQLQDSIDQINRAGGDSSGQYQELMKANDEWLDTTDALAISQNWQKGQPPQSDFAAYIETNSRGEIRNIDIGRAGQKTGYLETSGVINGFRIFGKSQSKKFGDEGKNVFKLGNEIFSASDRVKVGPDGTFKAEILTPQSKQTTGVGKFTKAISENYEVNPFSLKTQKYSNTGEWTQFGNTFYKKLENGQYEKYINATKDQLNINDDDLLSNLPKEMQSQFQEKTLKTNDYSSFKPPVDDSSLMTPAPQSSLQRQTSQTPAYTPAYTGGVERTQSPTERAPQSTGGIAQKALNVGKGLLGYLFGGGK